MHYATGISPDNYGPPQRSPNVLNGNVLRNHWFQRRLKLAMVILPPTLKQLAAKIVVLKELPTAHLPKTVKEDFQALTNLPGNFAVTETSRKVLYV